MPKVSVRPPISLGDDFMEAIRLQKSFYHYQANCSLADFADIESECIEIKAVAALQEPNQPSYWGAFAKVDMKGPRLLGEYFGTIEAVPEEGSRKENSLTDHVFYNSFQLSRNTALIPREDEEFWPRKANCAPCQTLANIEVRPYANRVIYAIPRGITIRAGQQLLPFYGEEYTFESKVFLNPDDNDETSQKKRQQYAYTPRNIQLDPKFLKVLRMPAGLTFSKPVFDALNIHTINLPILAHDARGHALPQHQQENPTLLHLACWMADENTLSALLAKGANPNQYTRKMGVSVLHAIAMSPHYSSASEKIACIEQLRYAGAHLTLQDKNDHSILHCAIQSGQIELAIALIQLEPKLTSLVNSKDQDFFIYAISLGATEMLQALSPFITSKFLSDYVRYDVEIDYLNQTLKKLRSKFSSFIDKLY